VETPETPTNQFSQNHSDTPQISTSSELTQDSKKTTEATKIFNVVRVQQEPRNVEMKLKTEKMKKKSLAAENTIHAEQLRESEEYSEYLTTLRRNNARGKTDTEKYIQIWGNLLNKVHKKVEEVTKECKQQNCEC